MTFYARHPRVLWRRTPGATVLLPAGRTEALALSGSGTALWDLIEHPVSLDAIVSWMSARFGVPVAEITTAVVPILAQLASCEAIEVTDS